MAKRKTWYNEDMHKRGFCDGFTMVELSLSLVFISMLSIAVVLVITGAISSYHRSIVLNKVDTVGTSIADDMKRSIQLAEGAGSLKRLCGERYSGSSEGAAEAAAECEADGGKNFAVVTRYADVKMNGQDLGSVPVFGALCTGSYSYIWNSGYFFNDEYEVEAGVKKAWLAYQINNRINAAIGFKLLKVLDEDRAVCETAVRTSVEGEANTNNYKISPANAGGKVIDSEFDLTSISLTEAPVEYLGNRSGSNDMKIVDGGEAADVTDDSTVSDEDSTEPDDSPIDDDDSPIDEGDDEESDSVNDSNLAIYYLTTSISEQIETGRNSYYYTSFVLGTVQGGVNINASGNFCAPPGGFNDAVENLDYCAINKFNFAALASGG